MGFHRTFKSRLHTPYADWNGIPEGDRKFLSLGLLIVLLVWISLHSHLGIIFIELVYSRGFTFVNGIE